MGDYTSKELRCEPDLMVQPENTTFFTTQQLNTSVDGGGCTATNITSYHGEQCTDSVDVNDDISKCHTAVDDKLICEPFVEPIQLNSSTFNSFNSQHSTKKDDSFATLKRQEVGEYSSYQAVKKMTRLVTERQDLKDNSTNGQLSNKDSTLSQNENQLRVLRSSKKHSLTKKNTESYKNQGNDEISMSLCETSRLTQSSNVRKNSCETSINSNTHVCDLCNRRYPTKSKLLVHRRTHTGENPFLCTLCSRAFTQKSDVDLHIKTHTAKNPHACQFCRKTFSQSIDLTKHERIHTGEKPFVCSFCAKAFAQKGNMDVHVRTHTGNKPFACQFCHKTFSQKGDLTKHIRTHTLERPFVCSVCSLAFSEQTNLSKHKRTHTGEKPYVCFACCKTFAHSDVLKKHIRSHILERPFVCSVCSRAFSQRCNLNRHKITHTDTGEKPYVCSVCSKTFTRVYHLNRHKRTHERKLGNRLFVRFSFS